METSFKKPLSGIIPPLVTPLKDNETLDIESLERLIEHLIAGGVHGLFVLGTTGEEQSLSYDVRKQMIKESCRINRGRLPLLACITDTSIEESIRLAKKAADYGADGVVSAPRKAHCPVKAGGGFQGLLSQCRLFPECDVQDAAPQGLRHARRS